ncbi:MAG: hypothetical protein QME79_07975 [Bacillota bacterium]|nr:hypothetical protein [Bacillota bacterium]
MQVPLVNGLAEARLRVAESVPCTRAAKGESARYSVAPKANGWVTLAGEAAVTMGDPEFIT